MLNIKKVITSKLNAIEDGFSIQKLHPLSVSYVAWTSSSMRPTAVIKILNDIAINRRVSVIEFGSGISTIYMAMLLRDFEGFIYSIEHNSEWIKVLEGSCKLLGLENVEFIYAPLTNYTDNEVSCEWYDKKEILKKIRNIKFDLVVVDGPPAYTKFSRLNRYPALPFIQDCLNSSFSIYIDDINRKGEKEVVKIWEKNYNLKFSLINGGIGRAFKGNSFNIC